MDEPSEFLYEYTRWGVQYVTPNAGLAFSRSQDGDVKQISYHESE